MNSLFVWYQFNLIFIVTDASVFSSNFTQSYYMFRLTYFIIYNFMMKFILIIVQQKTPCWFLCKPNRKPQSHQRWCQAYMAACECLYIHVWCGYLVSRGQWVCFVICHSRYIYIYIYIPLWYRGAYVEYLRSVAKDIYLSIGQLP